MPPAPARGPATLVFADDPLYLEVLYARVARVGFKKMEAISVLQCVRKVGLPCPSPREESQCLTYQ